MRNSQINGQEDQEPVEESNRESLGHMSISQKGGY